MFYSLRFLVPYAHISLGRFQRSDPLGDRLPPAVRCGERHVSNRLGRMATLSRGRDRPRDTQRGRPPHSQDPRIPLRHHHLRAFHPRNQWYHPQAFGKHNPRTQYRGGQLQHRRTREFRNCGCNFHHFQYSLQRFFKVGFCQKCAGSSTIDERSHIRSQFPYLPTLIFFLCFQFSSSFR